MLVDCGSVPPVFPPLPAAAPCLSLKLLPSPTVSAAQWWLASSTPTVTLALTSRKQSAPLNF